MDHEFLVEFDTKLHKSISKVNVSQETSFYKIGNDDKIQSEVIDIISIYFNNYQLTHINKDENIINFVNI